nr:hypothetical protein Iba_chr10dCG10710 [Ipomoea batatas]
MRESNAAVSVRGWLRRCRDDCLEPEIPTRARGDRQMKSFGSGVIDEIIGAARVDQGNDRCTRNNQPNLHCLGVAYASDRMDCNRGPVFVVPPFPPGRASLAAAVEIVCYSAQIVVIFKTNSQRWSQIRGSLLPSKVGNSSLVNRVGRGVESAGCGRVVSGVAWVPREEVTAVVLVVCDWQRECTIWERLATVSVRASTVAGSSSSFSMDKALVNGREAGVEEEEDLAMMDRRKNEDLQCGN